jgi:hypothetical protein
MTISKDEVEHARLISEYKYVVDNSQSKVVHARREGWRDIARNMKNRDYPVEEIIALTGLSVEDIEKL